MGPPRRILAKGLGQWLHSQLPSDGPFSKYHATLTNPEDLEQRSVNLLVARKTKKGDKILLRIRPHTSAVPAWKEAFQMLTPSRCNSSRHRSPSHCQSSPRSYQRQGTGSRTGKHQETVSRQLSLKSFLSSLNGRCSVW